MRERSITAHIAAACLSGVLLIELAACALIQPRTTIDAAENRTRVDASETGPTREVVIVIGGAYVGPDGERQSGHHQFRAGSGGGSGGYDGLAARNEKRREARRADY